MQELTKAQREPLFELVRFQQDLKQEPVFHVSGGGEVRIFPNRYCRPEQAIVEIPREIVEMWADAEYVSLSQRTMGGSVLSYTPTTFILRQEAIAYADWMSKPGAVRAVFSLWDKLVEDVPSLVWGLIGGVGSSVVLHWLGIR